MNLRKQEEEQTDQTRGERRMQPRWMRTQLQSLLHPASGYSPSSLLLPVHVPECQYCVCPHEVGRKQEKEFPPQSVDEPVVWHCCARIVELDTSYERQYMQWDSGGRVAVRWRKARRGEGQSSTESRGPDVTGTDEWSFGADGNSDQKEGRRQH
jgi:hypothetical protein